MVDTDGVPHLPKLGKALGKFFIETYWSYPKAIFHPHNEFIVLKKKVIKNKLKINKNLFTNRIVVSPMCQYSSDDGCPSEWHYHHLRNLLMTGAGSLVIESTAVSKEGKITHKDLCLYNKKHLNGHKKLLKFLKKIRNIPIILQISHAGRKGSAEIPWIKKTAL